MANTSELEQEQQRRHRYLEGNYKSFCSHCLAEMDSFWRCYRLEHHGSLNTQLTL
jgi:hypothetical protein